jgi:hypothetical protein
LTKLITLLLLIAIAGSALFTPSVDAATKKSKKTKSKTPTVYVAKLKGTSSFKTALGNATASEKSGKKSYEITLENVPPRAGKKVLVFIDNIEVGLIKVDALGDGELTVDRTDDNLPTVTNTSIIEIRMKDDGDVVEKGTFKKKK